MISDFAHDLAPKPVQPRSRRRLVVILLVSAAFTMTAVATCYAVAKAVTAMLAGLAAVAVAIATLAAFFPIIAMLGWMLLSGDLFSFVVVLVQILR
jgi:hypothetical protein